MSFDWINYLELAKKLQDSPNSLGSEEASYRTAISRAYYAVFHLALTFAESEGYSSSQSGYDHKNVPGYFRGGSPDRLRKRIAMNLDRIRDDRRKADYEQNLRGMSPEALARQSIRYADHIVADLQSLSS